MDTRQIQKTGGSSFFITLPKEWIIRNKLKQKDVLQVFQVENNDLVIRKTENKVIKSINISVDQYGEDHLSREILACYVSGYDEIILTSKKSFLSEKRNMLKRINDLMFGFETFNEESNTVILKNISFQNIPIGIHITKMVKNIHFMYLDLVTSINNHDLKMVEDVISRDSEIDKINFLIMRKNIYEIKTLGTGEMSNTPLIDAIYNEHRSTRLERIADHIVKIASTFLVQKSNFSKKNLKLLKEINKYFQLCEKVVITNDKKCANEIIDMHKKNKNKNANNLSDNRFSNCIIQYSISRIKSYVVNIAEDTINFSYKK